MEIKRNLLNVKSHIPVNVTLVAVSKTKPNSAIEEAYSCGQRIFGENKVQELLDKHNTLPEDIEWHMIGHLQSNKVKFIAPFISLIHSVDSIRLLDKINDEGIKNDRRIPILLQFYIAKEESKFGFDKSSISELIELISRKKYDGIEIRGVMGMASFVDDRTIVQEEFRNLKYIFGQIKNGIEKFTSSFDTISMGMSGDYPIAIEEGSTMVRVGSNIFGSRNYNK